MRESTITALVFSLLALTGAISLMIVAPAHSTMVVCGPQAAFSGAAACR
jgi:hypothetical protein